MKNSNTFKVRKSIFSKWSVHPCIWLAAILIIALPGCKKDDEEEPKKPEIIYEADVELPADAGEVGLVVNTREIFRKGYTPTTAEVTFSAYPEFNRTLEIEPVTSVAFLKIPNDTLTDEQVNAFASGVSVSITIYDSDQNQLAVYQRDDQLVDDTNTPVTIQTSLAYILPPVHLKTHIPYYIQPEYVPGDGDFDAGSILQGVSSRTYTFNTPPDVVTFHFKYYLEEVEDEDNTFYIKRGHPTEEGGTYYFVMLPGDNRIDVTTDPTYAVKFEFVQTAEGWIHIRKAGTETYLKIVEATASLSNYDKAFALEANPEVGFRFISTNIEWSGTDRGTKYSPPIMPPAKIEFAYAAKLNNCAPGSLTLEVGLAKSRTSTRTLQTTESLQFFAGAEASLGMSVGLSAGGGVPVVGKVDASVEFNSSLSISTNVTTSNSNTISSENSVTSEVSFVRTLEVLPYTGVEVFDAVRVVKNARLPFTQVIRVTANYTNGIPLTGGEIRTQMMANFVSGVPIQVGADFVDVGISGYVTINEMFETETGVHEIPDACGG